MADIANPTNPIPLGKYNTAGTAKDVQLAGNYAYIADQTEGVQVIDVSDPQNMSEVGFYNTPGFTRDLFVEGNLVYIIDWDYGLKISELRFPMQNTTDLVQSDYSKPEGFL